MSQPRPRASWVLHQAKWNPFSLCSQCVLAAVSQHPVVSGLLVPCPGMIKTHFPWNARCGAHLGFPPPERRRKLQEADFVAWDSALMLDCQCSFCLENTAMVWETHGQSFCLSPAARGASLWHPWAELLLQVDWRSEQWQSYRMPQLRVLGTVL